MTTMHKTGTREEWLAARLKLLEAEKAHTRQGDALARQRQALPWVRVEKDYLFETEQGPAALEDLFGGRSQLLVYHFMFGPDYTVGCPSCSSIADGFNGIVVHLENHDVAFSAVSRAALPKLLAFRKRMGWSFPWASSGQTDFNFDYHVSFTREELASGKVMYNYRATDAADAHDELPGLSAFFRDEDGAVYHTYSDYARGGEEALGTLMILDRAPKGRNETGTLSFVRRKDEYADAPKTQSCCD